MPINASGNYGTSHSSQLANFFDSDKIMKAVDKGIRKQLGWFGGYVRRAARNSLKEKAGFSKPGEVPHVHTIYYRQTKTTKTTAGKIKVKVVTPKRSILFKDSILYSYDAKAQEVIIGPFLFNGGDKTNPVPALLEDGGVVTRKIGKTGRVKIARYSARPYMRPAFERSLIAFRKRLEGFVTKG